MRFLNLLFSLILSFLLVANAHAQELNCTVTVNAQKITSKDAKIFKTLERTIMEFMNSRKWTNDVFRPEERIECSIFLTLDGDLGDNNYSGSLMVQSSRPVMNSNYNSTMLNFMDRDIIIQYQEFQPIEFNENIFVASLSSYLGFYANLIIGLDYDSYSKKGGQIHLEQAEKIMNVVPSDDNAQGWRSFDGQNNRYWLITNLLNGRYEDYRTAWYDYHLNGIDLLYNDLEQGRDNVKSALEQMKGVATDNRNSMTMRLFIDAKEDEITKLFAPADQETKTNVFKALISMDPTKTSDYQKNLFKR